MSLSPTPEARITYSTARDICNDIMAGAIDFAFEAKFSAHPLVTTAIWSGLLLSVKPALEKHGIFEDVQKHFVRSVSDRYHIGLDDVEILADLKAVMQKYCSALEEGIGVIDSEIKIAVFLDFVSSVDKDCTDNGPEASPEYTRLFSKYTFLLASHVDSIIYGVDNGMLLQFGVQSRAYAQSTQRQSEPIHQPAPKTAATPSDNASQRKPISPELIVGIVAALLMIFVMVYAATVAPKEAAAAKAEATEANWFDEWTLQQQTQPQELKPVPRPQNGAILKGHGYGESQITVTASEYEDCVVSLKTASGELRIAFFVRAGQTISKNVPAEYLYVYFASGDTWYGYGEGKMFGDNTVYSMDDELLDFTQYTWEYTLTPITYGNFSETPIDEDDFF